MSLPRGNRKRIVKGWHPRRVDHARREGEGDPADFCRFRSFNGIGLFLAICSVSLIQRYSSSSSSFLLVRAFPCPVFARSSGTWLRAGRNSRVTWWLATQKNFRFTTRWSWTLNANWCKYASPVFLSLL